MSTSLLPFERTPFTKIVDFCSVSFKKNYVFFDKLRFLNFFEEEQSVFLKKKKTAENKFDKKIIHLDLTDV
jgi:hypothetical protein